MISSLTELNAQEIKALADTQRLFVSASSVSKAFVTLTTGIVEHANQLPAGTNSADLMKTLGDIFSSPQRTTFDKVRQQQIKSFFSQLIRILPNISEDEKSFNLIVDNRVSYTDSDRKQALESLKSYLPETVFRLSMHIPTFKEFCETNTELEKSWGQLLSENDQMGEKVISIDRKSSLSVYNFYTGTYLITQLFASKNTSPSDEFDSALLAKCCELGLYQALSVRCDVHSQQLRENISIFQESFFISAVQHDIEKLTLYWAMGYFRAAQMLFTLACAIEQATSDATKSTPYYRQSIEYFCRAYLLEPYPTSQKILSVYNQGNVLPSEEDNKTTIFEDNHLSEADYDTIRTEQHELLLKLIPDLDKK